MTINVNADKDELGKSSDRELARDVPLGSDAVADDSKYRSENKPDSKNGDLSSTQFLIGLSRWHPFTGFFFFLADRLFPGRMPDHERVNGLRVRFPKFFGSMIFLDVIVLLLVIAGLVTVGLQTIKTMLF